MRRVNRPAWRVAASTFMILLVAVLAIPAIADEPSQTLSEAEPVVVDPSIQAVWEMTDGLIASGETNRAWAFGPEPIAAAYEYYPQSPTGYRKIVYYDKGRLDLVDPQAPSGSIWMVSGALLTVELLNGQIQLGQSEFVNREPATIPLVGDFEQANPVTYATLAPFASIEPFDPEPEQADELRAPRRSSEGRLQQIGKEVTELLTADGRIIPGEVIGQGIDIGAYDEILGHNVASPFTDWASGPGVPALNILGLPITEPYWISTEVDGVPTLVLIQAFERRTLTYTPSNPEGWRLESGNVGMHYRLWRGLERPGRAELARMAADIPFGEEILEAAREHYIDPYMFAAISLNTTGGNPFSIAPNGGYGIMGASANESLEVADLSDPATNVQVAADQFAAQMYAAWDWHTILTSYFTTASSLASAGAVIANPAEWATAVLDTASQLEAEYPPSGPKVDPVRDVGSFVGEGRAAYYSESYTVEWWEGAMLKHVSWGNAVEYWAPDPNGFYCVHPDYLIGERLKLEANDRVLECTIGDQVAIPHQIAWRAKWAVEISWPTFIALGLDRNNEVKVSYLGDRTIEPTPTPAPSETPEPTEQKPGIAQPEVGAPNPDLETPPATATPEPDDPPGTDSTPQPGSTAAPAQSTPTPTPIPGVTPTPTP